MMSGMMQGARVGGVIMLVGCLHNFYTFFDGCFGDKVVDVFWPKGGGVKAVI